MRVGMGQRRMDMLVVMGFPTIPLEIMLVPVMLVVDMSVRVVQASMRVPVSMLLGQMQPHADAHQQGGDPEIRRRTLPEQQQ